MSAREAVLGAVRQALAAQAAPVAEPLAYRRCGDLAPDARIARFVDRLHDYGVGVTVVERELDVPTAVQSRLSAWGIDRLAAPDDLPNAWRPTGVEILAEAAIDPRDLDLIAASLTGCALAVAETGSIVLDGGLAQGRRALTLLPDRHLCIVLASQVVETLPEAIQTLARAAGERRPLTFFSGPSATADIEFDRVVGVHGPRALEVIVVTGGAPLKKT